MCDVGDEGDAASGIECPVLIVREVLLSSSFRHVVSVVQPAYCDVAGVEPGGRAGQD